MATNVRRIMNSVPVPNPDPTLCKNEIRIRNLVNYMHNYPYYILQSGNSSLESSEWNCRKYVFLQTTRNLQNRVYWNSLKWAVNRFYVGSTRNRLRFNPNSIGVKYRLIIWNGGGDTPYTCFDHLIGQKLFLFILN